MQAVPLFLVLQTRPLGKRLLAEKVLTKRYYSKKKKKTSLLFNKFNIKTSKKFISQLLVSLLP